MDVGIRVWTALNKYVVVPFFLWCCPFFVLWCIFPLLWIQRSVCFPQQWYQIYGLGDQRIEGYWRSLRKLMMDPCRVLMSKVSWQCESNSVFQWRDLAYKFRSVIIQYSQNEEQVGKHIKLCVERTYDEHPWWCRFKIKLKILIKGMIVDKQFKF